MQDRSDYIYFCDHCKRTMSEAQYQRSHLCSECQKK